jgi:medium-chain acyl-[acyl-carrier-protein] hydrolase
METTRLSFTVHSFDADAFGHVAPAALAGYLQEAAGVSAESLGFGMTALNRAGATWVLAREQLVLDQPVRWGETIEVETWPSGLDRLAAFRDFRLHREGEEIGRALTTWFAIDLASRRPLRPQGLFSERFHTETPHVLAPEAPLPELPDPEVDRRFQVRFADIDANQHVTNASYVSWALEAVDEPTWRDARLARLDVQFLAECTLGAFVRSRSSPDGAAGPAPRASRLHAIVREADERPVARARTWWVPRG